MKLLLDECLPYRLRPLIVGHDVFTVGYMGWDGIKNGRLLALAATNGFDAIVTVDSGMPHEQNTAALPLAIIVLHGPSNDLDDLITLVPALLVALGNLAPRSVLHVG